MHLLLSMVSDALGRQYSKEAHGAVTRFEVLIRQCCSSDA